MFTPLQLPGIDKEDIAQADSLLRAGVERRIETFAGMTWNDRFHLILNDLWHVGLKLVVVFVLFIVGRWLIKRLIKLLNIVFEKRKVDLTLRSFIRGITNTFLYLILFYAMIAWLGVNTSLFVALFAAAGLAIGMAMSGVFQNFAGGVMILLLKPFRAGDWVRIGDDAGAVIDISLFNTVLRTADNRTILIPNGSVSTSVVDNYNAAKTRRLEWIVSLADGTDFISARKLLEEIIAAETKIMKNPAPEVVIVKLNPNALDIVIHGWVASRDYWEVLYRVNSNIYTTMPQKGFDFDSTQSIRITSAVKPQD